MVPFPICHSEAGKTSALLTFTLCHFITVMLMTLTRDAAYGGVVRSLKTWGEEPTMASWALAHEQGDSITAARIGGGGGMRQFL